MSRWWVSILVLFACLVVFPAHVTATYWYIDNQASGNNNGTSWQNAWQSFNAIIWGTNGIKAGDTLYISGGTSSQTYFETLTPGASGISGSPITIDVGANSPTPAGHNGTVIIDGGASRSRGIYISGKSYLIINGLSLSTRRFLIQNLANGGEAGVDIDGNCNHLTVQYLDIDNATSRGIKIDGYNGGNYNGITDTLIKGNYVHTGFVDNSIQTDCFYSQGTVDTIYDGNIAVQANNGASHSDGIQSYQDTRLIVRNNYLEFPNGRGNNNSQAYIQEPLSGKNIDYAYIYNNVIIGSSLQPGQAIILKTAGTGGLYYLWNNTIVAQHPSGTALNLYNCTDAMIGQIKNNLFYSPGGYLLYAPTSLTANKVNNNLLYRVAGTVVSHLGSDRTWSQHQAFGYDVNGLNANPNFNTDNQYQLLSTSPAIDSGTNLSSYFTTDRNNNMRPSGTAWDIGAYEYQSNSAPPIPEDFNADGVVDFLDLIKTITSNLGIFAYNQVVTYLSH